MIDSIYFDMDGTLANLYGVEDWLEKLRAYDPSPYENAIPLVNMRALAKRLNNLQREGFHIGIISWLSKIPNDEYDEKVIAAKVSWLSKHLHSVHWDEIKIVAHGIPKETIAEYADTGILFDDEEKNRKAWGANAHDEKNILKVLDSLKGL